MFKIISELIIICILSTNHLCTGHPKYETDLNKSDVILKLAGNHIIEKSWNQNKTSEHLARINQNETLNDSTNIKERIQRLGYTTGYGGAGGIGGISSYPGTGISGYPVKIDIGGVLLGALVGVGAILVIPKIISIIHGGYLGGQYARSDNDQGSDYVATMLTKLDDLMGQNNIDSTSCMQRAVCTYVKTTESNMVTGVGDQVDQIVHALSGNSFVEYILDGTAIKDAVEHGKNANGKECKAIYSGCNLDPNILMKILTKIIPKN